MEPDNKGVAELLIKEAKEVLRTECKKATPQTIDHITQVKKEACTLYGLIKTVPAGREQSIALTKLEECIMWATKAITK